jgi:HlyD family secretion protein
VITESRSQTLGIPIIALTVRERDEVEALDTELSDDQEAAVEALLGDEDEDVEGVFVIRGGEARFVPVRVGITGREHFEVLSGLASGDSVVAGPYQAIRELDDGAPVRILTDAASTSTPREQPE